MTGVVKMVGISSMVEQVLDALVVTTTSSSVQCRVTVVVLSVDVTAPRKTEFNVVFCVALACFDQCCFAGPVLKINADASAQKGI